MGDLWGKGDVYLGEVTEHSVQYCAGYTVKKMTAKDDPRLTGRAPEFAQPSLVPGLGANAMPEIASTLLEFNLEEREADVPSALRHGSRVLPLGRYLRRKLRVEVGLPPDAPQATLDEAKERLRPLREAAFDASASFKETVIRAADGKVARMESLSLIRKKRGSLQ